jgi:hypothetical protein
VKSRSHAELIAEAEHALAAARRLVDEQSAIVQRLERTGGCNSEAVDLLNNLRELLAARQRRLARVRSWPSWDNAAIGGQVAHERRGATDCGQYRLRKA